MIMILKLSFEVYTGFHFPSLLHFVANINGIMSKGSFQGGEKKSTYIFAVSFQSESKNLQQPMDSTQHKSGLFLWPLKQNLKFYQLLSFLLLSLVKAKQRYIFL